MPQAFIKVIVFAAGSVLLIPVGRAHDVITTKLTYSRDISRIFAKRCLSCHGNEASIPLVSYPQVRPWAVDIKEQVLARRMPPWGAVKGFGSFAPDNGLTEEELLTIAAWVVGGAPEGNPLTLPRAIQPGVIPALPPLHDAMAVNRSRRLKRSIVLAGIRPDPLAEVPTARIVATLPDGHKQPLLWLFRYDPKWKRIFRLREPVSLPAGSVVESDVPLHFVLETL